MSAAVTHFDKPDYARAFFYLSMLIEHLHHAIENGQEIDVHYETGKVQGAPDVSHATFKFDGSLECRFSVKPVAPERSDEFFLNRTSSLASGLK